MAIADIGNYFRAIGQDLEIIFNNPSDKSESRNERILSVTSRILGGVLAVVATTRFITTLITYATDPLSPLWIVSAVVTAVLAYDLLKLGSHIERNIQRREMTLVGAGLTAVTNPGFYLEEQKDIDFQKNNGISYAFRDTVFFQHFAKWVK